MGKYGETGNWAGKEKTAKFQVGEEKRRGKETFLGLQRAIWATKTFHGKHGVAHRKSLIVF